MRQNELAFAALLLSTLFTAGVGADQPQSSPPARTARDMAVSLPEVKKSVLAATGYDSGSVELTVGTYTLTVTLINSKLANPAARELEAHKIAATITRAIATRAEYKRIQALHIDYVARSAGEDESHIVDGIDFWKDPQGDFKLHTT